MQIIKNLYVSNEKKTKNKKKTIRQEHNRVKLVKLHTHEYWWGIHSIDGKNSRVREREREMERIGREKINV